MLNIFSEQVVLSKGGGGYQIVSALITIDGNTIGGVLECTRGDEVFEKARSCNLDFHDYGTKLISPSFINGHTHLAMSAYRGVGGLAARADNVVEDLFYEMESHLQPGDVRAFTRLGAYESLMCGVGSVWDHYYYGEEVGEALLDTGLSGVIAPTMQDLSGPGVPRLEKELAAVEAIQGNQRFRDGGILAAFGPHATDTVSSELWQRILKHAEIHHLPVHCHLAQSPQEYQRSLDRHGVSPVEFLERLGVLAGDFPQLWVHGIYLSNRDLESLKDSGAVLGYCGYSQLQFGFSANFEAWQNMGLPMVLGTDCSASNDSMDVQAELRLLAGAHFFKPTFSQENLRFCRNNNGDSLSELANLRNQLFSKVEKYSEPDRLLDTVWRIPGRLHPEMVFGEIKPGALANLVVWDVEHPAFWPSTDVLRALSMNRVVLGIEQMMVAGKWIGESGHYQQSLRQSDAYEAHRMEARSRLEGLLRRCGLE